MSNAPRADTQLAREPVKVDPGLTGTCCSTLCSLRSSSADAREERGRYLHLHPQEAGGWGRVETSRCYTDPKPTSHAIRVGGA
jgi:hypothetical protein